MRDDQRASREGVDGGDRRAAPRRFRTRTLVVGIVVLLAGGLAIEQVGAAPRPTWRPTTKWSSFEPRLAPKPAASDSGKVPTDAAALVAADQQADAAITRSAALSPTTAAETPKSTPRLKALGPRVCPNLFNYKASFQRQIERLIVASPGVTTQLLKIRERGLEKLEFQQARFGCAAVSS